MFLPFWQVVVEPLVTHTRPATHSAAWWDTDNLQVLLSIQVVLAYVCQQICSFVTKNSKLGLLKCFSMYRIWMTVIGPTACTSPPSREWRTPASSQMTSPTWAQHCWRRMTLARLVSESSAPRSSVVWKTSSTDAVVFIFSAAASLFPEFLGAFLKHSSSAVFDLLEDYQSLCQDKVQSVYMCVLCQADHLLAVFSFLGVRTVSIFQLAARNPISFEWFL